MKHLWKKCGVWSAALLCLALTLCLFVGCTDGHDPDESGTETDTVTESGAPTDTASDTEGDTSADSTVETESDTSTDTSTDTSPDTSDASDTDAPDTGDGETDPTEESETLAWTPDTGKFNEGIVDYDKVVETEVQNAYPDGKVGQSMNPGDDGVVTVFNTDFSDGDVLVGGLMSPRSTDNVRVIDGQLYMPYSAESADHLAEGGWTTWYTTAPAGLVTYKQTAFSLTWDVSSVNNYTSAHQAAIIGCYVSHAAGKIPDNPGDGLWISYQENANELIVYHPDNKNWPAAWSHIPVEPGLMSGTFETSVVCTPERTTYVYITAEGSTVERLVATIRFEDGKIRTYDEGGTMVSESDCTTDSLAGENYSIFVHGGGRAAIEAVALLGASRGKVIEHTTVTATPTEGNALGLDITDKTDLVSICYSVWFDAILGSGEGKVESWHNITEILAGNQSWGGATAFHYWAKPAEGYYRSSDKSVIRTHMTQLYTAGVDFIIIDLTNAHDGYIGAGEWNSYVQTPMDAICDTIMEMRAEGLGTPYVVFWAGDSQGALYQALYDNYHAVDKWKDCFVYWDGKPFMLTTHTTPANFPLKDQLTTRSMWGLGVDYEGGQWSFLSTDNQDRVTYGADGKAEQVSVAVAAQETYMSMPTAHGREGGLFWFKQWHQAFETHPKIVTLTWWNEWAAQRLPVGDEYHFTDNYNADYSRDIEPMDGGHGDQYYQWLIQYIAAYKGGEDCPILVEDKYIPRAERWLDSLD